MSYQIKLIVHREQYFMERHGIHILKHLSNLNINYIPLVIHYISSFPQTNFLQRPSLIPFLFSVSNTSSLMSLLPLVHTSLPDFNDRVNFTFRNILQSTLKFRICVQLYHFFLPFFFFCLKNILFSIMSYLSHLKSMHFQLIFCGKLNILFCSFIIQAVSSMMYFMMKSNDNCAHISTEGDHNFVYR